MSSSLDFLSLNDVDVHNKRVLVRVDFNVPMKDGVITDTSRIDRTMPTVQALLRRDAAIILSSHSGKPKGFEADLSLKPCAEYLQKQMPETRITFVPDCVGPEVKAAVDKMKPGQILVLENLRFHKEEEKNTAAFAEEMAKLADVFVNDAFASSHRAHASVVGISKLLPSAAGVLMEQELWSLGRALEAPKHPVMAVASGAKVSTKIGLLKHLVKKVDMLVLGGGMATTVLAAQGKAIGTSLNEPSMHEDVRQMLEIAKEHKCEIILPVDFVVAREFKNGTKTAVVDANSIPSDQMVLDIGPKSIVAINAKVDACKTVIWNGPLGAFELDGCKTGTKDVAHHVAERTASDGLLSVAGGGDTVAALVQLIPDENFTYVSTAGGAFMEWMEGLVLPGVSALNEAYTKNASILDLKVGDVMTTQVVTVGEDELVGDARAVLDIKIFRHLPVVNKAEEFVGMLTHRDLLSLSVSSLAKGKVSSLRVCSLSSDVEAEKKSIDSTKISEVMNKDVVTVGPQLTVAAAAKLIVDHKYGALPVVSKGNQLVGIITEADFAKLFLRLVSNSEDIKRSVTAALKLRKA